MKSYTKIKTADSKARPPKFRKAKLQDSAEWVLDIQPYPPTEQGQYDFLVELEKRIRKYPKVNSVYYWEPEGFLVAGTNIPYLGRSLFDPQGNAYKAIYAWKPED